MSVSFVSLGIYSAGFRIDLCSDDLIVRLEEPEQLTAIVEEPEELIGILRDA